VNMNNIELGVFLALVATCVALVVCANARAVATWLGVMDHPDEGRKRHATPTPLVGGLAIILALMTTLLAAGVLSPAGLPPFFLAVILCGTGVALIGFADDQSPVSPLARTLFLVMFLLTAFSLHAGFNPGVFNWGSFVPTAVPGWLFFSIILVACVGVVNAVNMADGQNGIVSGMFLTWFMCLLLVTRDVSLSLPAALCVGPALVVFLFNLRGKLFLGDCGTYGVTFVIGMMALAAHARGVLTIEMIAVWFFVPVMDCIRLVITRVAEGRSPFLGDRNHFHHRLQDKLGHRVGLMTYGGTVAGSSLLVSLLPHLSLLCISVLAAFYFSFAWLTDSEVQASEDDSQGDDSSEESARIVVIRGGKEN